MTQLNGNVSNALSHEYCIFHVFTDLSAVEDPTFTTRSLREDGLKTTRRIFADTGYRTASGQIAICIESDIGVDEFISAEKDSRIPYLKDVQMASRITRQIIADGRHRKAVAMEFAENNVGTWADDIKRIMVALIMRRDNKQTTMDDWLHIGSALNEQSGTVTKMNFPDYLHATQSGIRRFMELEGIGDVAQVEGAKAAKVVIDRRMIGKGADQVGRYVNISLRLLRMEAADVFMSRAFKRSREKLGVVHLNQPTLLDADDTCFKFGVDAIAHRLATNSVTGRFEDSAADFYRTCDLFACEAKDLAIRNDMTVEEAFKVTVIVGGREEMTLKELLIRKVGLFRPGDTSDCAKNIRHIGDIRKKLRDNSGGKLNVADGPASATEKRSGNRSAASAASAGAGAGAAARRTARGDAATGAATGAAAVAPAAPGVRGDNDGTSRTNTSGIGARLRQQAIDHAQLGGSRRVRARKGVETFDTTPSTRGGAVKKVGRDSRRSSRKGAGTGRARVKQTMRQVLSKAGSASTKQGKSGKRREGMNVENNTRQFNFDDDIPEAAPLGAEVYSESSARGVWDGSTDHAFCTFLSTARATREVERFSLGEMLSSLGIPQEHRSKLFLNGPEELFGIMHYLGIYASHKYVSGLSRQVQTFLGRQLPKTRTHCIRMNQDPNLAVGDALYHIAASKPEFAARFFGKLSAQLECDGFCVVEGVLHSSVMPEKVVVPKVAYHHFMERFANGDPDDDEQLLVAGHSALKFDIGEGFIKFLAHMDSTFPSETKRQTGESQDEWCAIVNNSDRKENDAQKISGRSRYMSTRKTLMEDMEQDESTVSLCRARAVMDVVAAATLKLILCTENAAENPTYSIPRSGGRVLGTVPGTPRQSLHCDFPHGDAESVLRGAHNCGYFCIMSGADEAELVVCRSSHRLYSVRSSTGNVAALRALSQGMFTEVITIPPYSIIYVRGDCVHGGAAFADHNGSKGGSALLRYHMYFIPAGFQIRDEVHFSGVFKPSCITDRGELPGEEESDMELEEEDSENENDDDDDDNDGDDDGEEDEQDNED